MTVDARPGPFDELSDELLVKLIQTCGPDQAPRLALLNKRFCGLCSPAVSLHALSTSWCKPGRTI